MRWLDDIIDTLDMSLGKLWEIVEDRKAWLLQFMRSQRVGHNLASEQQQSSPQHSMDAQYSFCS